MNKTNYVTLAIKEGEILKGSKLELASFNARKLKIEDGVLSFETLIGIEERDSNGKVRKDQAGKVIIKKRDVIAIEVLKENLSILIIDGVIIFPSNNEEADYA